MYQEMEMKHSPEKERTPSSMWRAIAKAEILVGSAKFRKSRKGAAAGILTISFVWATMIVPQLMLYLLSRFGDGFASMLALSLPGFMRSIVLVIWLALIVIPLSNSLEEVKIGQWEIMLSNNVRTRDILLGTFLAKIPLFGTMILFLSPLLIWPFIMFYEISIFAQVIIYSLVIIACLSSLWISTVISSAIQSRLGQSARGNDIAKALAWCTIPVLAVPSMAFMYFMPQFTQMLSLDLSLLLPSTWIADLITWLTIAFNGVGLPASSFLNIAHILWLNPLIEIAAICGFIIGILWVGLATADRYYSIQAGSRTEKVVTVGCDNVFVRGITRAFPGPFGVRVTTSLKEFGRKTENISKLGYCIFISILIPILLKYGGFANLVGDPLFSITMTVLMTGAMLGMFSALSFGGVGFMDSKDQLWILKSHAHGIRNFMSSRLISYFLIAIPYTLVPTLVVALFMELTLVEIVVLYISSLTITCSAAMIGVGVTSTNPSYTDTRSGAFAINQIATILIVMITLMGGLVFGLVTVIRSRDLILGLVQSFICMPLVGLLAIAIGAYRLGRIESA